jgi:hypothetical protein
VRVNAGGDPDRDDFGLPPVDIEVPDDARELDRDVQAYQRELRALRRRQRASRLRGPLTRDGMALPLLAGCLILALITSTLLIMFAADQTGAPDLPLSTAAPTAASNPAHAPARTPAAGKIGGPLPASTVVIRKQKVPLRSVAAAQPALLTLVPVDCSCATTLEQLSAQAARAHVPVYLVATQAGLPQLAQLARQAGQGPGHIAEDTGNVLGTTYGQDGVTAILVRTGGAVALVAHGLSQPLDPRVTTKLRQLGPAR